MLGDPVEGGDERRQVPAEGGRFPSTDTTLPRLPEALRLVTDVLPP
ncbi:hypothetical protein [Streptomyces wedmorensis]